MYWCGCFVVRNLNDEDVVDFVCCCFVGVFFCGCECVVGCVGRLFCVVVCGVIVCWFGICVCV